MKRKLFGILFTAFLILISLSFLLSSCSGSLGTEDTTAVTSYEPSETETGSITQPSDSESVTSAGNATEPVTESATEPATEPETEPVTEPVTEPATEPTTEPATEPVTEPLTDVHVHSFGPYEAVTAATCKTPGTEKRSCSCGYSETRATALADHVPVTDPGVPASCGVEGKTEGSHCSVCGTVLSAQTVIPGLSHSFYSSSGICSHCGYKDPTYGTLIYYEGFNSYQENASSTSVLNMLGWKTDSTVNGAYHNNTSTYSIVTKNGSKQLYIKNNTTDGADSYVIVLSAAEFGKYHESNYTYQYDMIYDDASAADRYIALVSDYNGSFYNSFHVRNRGNGNNQAHSYGSWITYDQSGTYYAANTNANSMVTRILGKSYNSSVQAFKGISISVRVAVDWENGSKCYVRVNTEGYPGSGKWTLVSVGRPGSPFTPGESGGAIVLKTGGKQNGWIDNILIWKGTGEEPSLNYRALVTSSTDACSGHTFRGEGTCLNPEKCIYCGEIKAAAVHSYKAVGSDRQCTVCGILESNISGGWKLQTIPAFIGGTRASSVYLCGQGVNNSALPKDSESEMMVISSTTAAMFDDYCGKLEEYGYSRTFSNAYDNNKFAEYYDGSTRIYTYYLNASKETRVIIDRNSTCSVSDFGYTASGDQTGTVVYQFGMPYSAKGTNISNNGENKIDCGMLYIIKLCDNKLFVIDGGGYQQFDTAEIDGLMKFMRDITGIPQGQKITVAGWYFTHCHSDHLAGFSLFLKKYYTQLTFERVICNFPTTFSDDTVLSGHKSNLAKLSNYIANYIGSDVPYLKIHTGEYFTLGNITVNCIYTHEDLVTAKTGVSAIAADFNNSSIVSRMDFEGIRFMILGDMNKPAQTKILANNSASTLKSDIVQLAHHVINDVRLLYQVIKAPAVFVPQSPQGAVNGSRGTWFAVARSYVEDNMLYYASEGTYGIKAENGKPKEAYVRSGVDGGAYTGWSW
ncbi:MAG: hypothetical protein MJ137_05705 [Clostridia bacterium]|nr:hypothetical protein [Clostridia bacterium]